MRPYRLFSSVFLLICLAFPAYSYDDTYRFRVIRVGADNVLNIRIVPSPHAAKVGKIPANTTGIVSTGRTARRGDYIWREIRFMGITGWVNSHFLLRDNSPASAASPLSAPVATTKGSVFLEPISCSGIAPFWGLLLNGKSATLDSLSGNDPLKLSLSPARQSPQKATAWAIDAEDEASRKPVTIIVRRTNQCSDGTSDIVFPYEAFISIKDGPFYAGCCNVAAKREQN